MRAQLSALANTARLLVISTPMIARSLKWLANSMPGADARAMVPDLVLVTPPKTAQGWILDAICREIGIRLPECDVRYSPFGEPLPAAPRYFFSHYMYYIGSLSSLRPVRRANAYIFATHLEASRHGITDELLARLLDTSDGVICMNKALRDELESLGVAAEKLSVVVGAASSEVYRPHSRRADGQVGFCSAYYSRKSPDLIVDIVRMLPQRSFVLLGKGWRDSPRFSELSSFANFEYVEASYTEYASYYAQMSVFVSASQLEGGPIPLLEAMMSNVVPVASRTGFAPDVIEHERNGFLFDVTASAAEVCQLIERAFEMNCAVDETVRHCDWQHYSTQIGALIGLRVRNSQLRKSGAAS